MNKIKTIITGHGYYACGIKSSFEMLALVPKNFIFINFTKDMDEKKLRRDFEAQLSHNEEVLFFTDLAGGTPFKIASEIGFENNKIEVVAGANLASLLETSFGEYENVHAYTHEVMTATKKSTVRFDEIIMSENVGEENGKKGI